MVSSSPVQRVWTKKDPRGAHTPEVPSSRSDAPSPSSWWWVLRSRGTVRTGREDRIGFGSPPRLDCAWSEIVEAFFLRGFDSEFLRRRFQEPCAHDSVVVAVVLAEWRFSFRSAGMTMVCPIRYYFLCVGIFVGINLCDFDLNVRSRSWQCVLKRNRLPLSPFTRVWQPPPNYLGTFIFTHYILSWM